jgi:hypothetical protein
MFATLWDKLKALLGGAEQAVQVDFTKSELEVVAIAQPLLAAAEAAAIRDLVIFVRGVLTAHPDPASMTVSDWETAVMNGLGKLGGDLLVTAQQLKSTLLQALISLVLASLPAA